MKEFDMKPFQRKSAPVPPPATAAAARRVLNAGSGPRSSGQLHRLFRGGSWREFRIDIDPHTSPDAVGSITDMKGQAPSRAFDAVWSSHSLEHLHTYEVPLALAEFRRVLKPDGFALITSPDLEFSGELPAETRPRARPLHLGGGPDHRARHPLWTFRFDRPRQALHGA